jgi:hypothetical protein
MNQATPVEISPQDVRDNLDFYLFGSNSQLVVKFSDDIKISGYFGKSYPWHTEGMVKQLLIVHLDSPLTLDTPDLENEVDDTFSFLLDEESWTVLFLARQGSTTLDQSQLMQAFFDETIGEDGKITYSREVKILGMQPPTS